ncbi:CRISPR-associated endonuclease Cas2 [Halobacillus amylolyticus]|uniref:CRISPR-associated endoribonuclease Cas2 n=1 Tax=Halobacillus amylolyticus TaxID=2932259 RepID=A0ABY4H6V5_9BACI|nr:CRISPR-associated endonuclease Cas2 [Halobacillus amylolyticus]UOR10507.1 CRISPR-associated endonuclease Cas2 [Halobacillus amylolyticus]
MRIMVFFDLPVVLKRDRKAYTKFRKFLLNDGYVMMQYSVYYRVCNGEEAVQKHMRRLRENVPPVNGAIRTLKITERQFEKMDILLGVETPVEKVGSNITDFF